MAKPKKYNNKRFNDKTGSFWLLAQHRFKTEKHPVVAGKERRTHKVSTLISEDELKMLQGLGNMIQDTADVALRVAIYEAFKADEKDVEPYRRYSDPLTKVKGHTARKRTLSVQLPKSEKMLLMSLASTLDITQKEAVRLAFIYLARGIREEVITSLTNSPKIAQTTLAREWSKTYDGKGSKLTDLRTAQSKAYELAQEDGQKWDAYRYELRGEVMDGMRYQSEGGRPLYVAGFDGNGHQVINWDIVDMEVSEIEDERIEAFCSGYESREEGIYDYFRVIVELSDEPARFLARMLSAPPVETEDYIPEEDEELEDIDWDEVIPNLKTREELNERGPEDHCPANEILQIRTGTGYSDTRRLAEDDEYFDQVAKKATEDYLRRLKEQEKMAAIRKKKVEQMRAKEEKRREEQMKDKKLEKPYHGISTFFWDI